MTSENIWNYSLPSGFELAPVEPPAILVVDDREENLYAMQKLLAKLDADIVTAASGADALALSLRQQFALILLDVQMPDMNGFEVAEFLRENEETASIPIIFLTAISKEEQYVFKGYDSGAVDYIFKPVNPTILLAKTKIFLNLARQQRHLKRLALALTELNERHVSLLQSMNEAVIGFQLEGQIIFANPVAQNLLASPNQLVGKKILPFLAGSEIAEGEWQHHPVYEACLKHDTLHFPEIQMSRANNTRFIAELRFGPFSPSTGPTGGVLAFTDITTRKRMEEILKRQATYDELTCIPNRHLFNKVFEQAHARSCRSGQPLALMYLDLNGFKPINDNFGHAIGDELLRSFVARCLETIRKGDLLARIGGDEFVILIEESVSEKNLEVMAKKICELCDYAFEVEDQLIRVSVSVGVAINYAKDISPEEMLDCADKLMYRAKKKESQQWLMKVFNGREDIDKS